MDAIGKTVARIEQEPVNEYFSRDSDTVLIHFTDGTALKIEGGSYEPVDQSVEALGAADVKAYARRVQGLRQQEWLTRLRRQEWLSISCEERGERKRAREAKMGPMTLMMRDTCSDVYADLLRTQRRFWFGDHEPEHVVRACKNCGERSCPNATVEVIGPSAPQYRKPPEFNWGKFEIKIEPGSISSASPSDPPSPAA